MDIPPEYRGREQTFLKHRVLRQYLEAWSRKLSSLKRHFGTVRLWYVDCFAGPWESEAEDKSDTSVAIGMKALEDALEPGAVQGGAVEARAIFVEANSTSARRLRDFLEGRPARGVEHVVLEGEFGARAKEIDQLIGSDPAFVFVDPTGWKGAGMAHIAPVVDGRVRDVMVNVMFHHINRWKYDAREFLRQQMREFFGIEESQLPADLDEIALMRLYRQRLSEQAKLDHVADLAVPHPTRNQTFFRLVVGGHAAIVLKLFRDIEMRVVGREAASIREKARARRSEERTGQLAFGLVPDMDSRYRAMRDADLPAAIGDVQTLLAKQGPTKFGAIWPRILADYHVTGGDLVAALRSQPWFSTAGRDRKSKLTDDQVVEVIRRPDQT